MTVLLVEDDKKRRDQIKSFLESDTVVVLTASGAHEAIRLLYKTSVDHVLSDLNLELSDGLWLANEIKKESMFGKMKMLLYSSKPIFDDLADLAKTMGVHICLSSTEPKELSREALNYLKQ